MLVFFRFYLPLITFILCYWHITLHGPTYINSSFSIQHSNERNHLKLALEGDFNLMTSLMATWENISPKTLLHAQDLAKDIQKTHPTTHPKLLPQTDLSAEILLAIASPQQFIALPSAVCKRRSINHACLNCANLTSDHLYQLRPDIAFIGDYSNPRFVQALRSLKIETCLIKTACCLEGITSIIMQMGEVTKHLAEAELLSLFMKSCMIDLDKQIVAKLAQQKNKLNPSKKILYLTHYGQMALPDKYSLTWQHLKRLNNLGFSFQLINSQEQEFPIIINIEKLQHLKPEVLLIGIPLDVSASSSMHWKISHVTSCVITCVDDQIQQSPTQLYALAYYDLVHALMKVMTDE